MKLGKSKVRLCSDWLTLKTRLSSVKSAVASRDVLSRIPTVRCSSSMRSLDMECRSPASKSLSSISSARRRDSTNGGLSKLTFDGWRESTQTLTLWEFLRVVVRYLALPSTVASSEVPKKPPLTISRRTWLLRSSHKSQRRARRKKKHLRRWMISKLKSSSKLKRPKKRNYKRKVSINITSKWMKKNQRFQSNVVLDVPWLF